MDWCAGECRMIITGYVIREVLKPSMAVCGTLIVLFAGYAWVTFLEKAVHAAIPGNLLAMLIGLKVGIALEILLPVSLYFGVILGLGRLYADSEMKGFMSCGVSPYRMHVIILCLSSLVAIVVGGLSLYLRPLAYAHSYQLKAQVVSGLGVGSLETKHFYERREGTLVFFAEGLDPETHRLQRVFIQSEHQDTLRIFTAKEAEDTIDPASGLSIPVLYDGFAYTMVRGGEIDHISQFSRLAIYPEERILEYKRKAASTEELWSSHALKDIAELQWRFSTPFSTVLLGLLAVPLSRSLPRAGKYAKIFTATVIFTVYYFFGLMAKILVEKGTLPLFPGIWLMVCGLALVVIFFSLPSRFNGKLVGGAM